MPNVPKPPNYKEHNIARTLGFLAAAICLFLAYATYSAGSTFNGLWFLSGALCSIVFLPRILASLGSASTGEPSDWGSRPSEFLIFLCMPFPAFAGVIAAQKLGLGGWFQLGGGFGGAIAFLYWVDRTWPTKGHAEEPATSTINRSAPSSAMWGLGTVAAVFIGWYLWRQYTGEDESNFHLYGWIAITIGIPLVSGALFQHLFGNRQQAASAQALEVSPPQTPNEPDYFGFDPERFRAAKAAPDPAPPPRTRSRFVELIEQNHVDIYSDEHAYKFAEALHGTIEAELERDINHPACPPDLRRFLQKVLDFYRRKRGPGGRGPGEIGHEKRRGIEDKRSR